MWQLQLVITEHQTGHISCQIFSDSLKYKYKLNQFGTFFHTLLWLTVKCVKSAWNTAAVVLLFDMASCYQRCYISELMDRRFVTGFRQYAALANNETSNKEEERESNGRGNRISTIHICQRGDLVRQQNEHGITSLSKHRRKTVLLRANRRCFFCKWIKICCLTKCKRSMSAFERNNESDLMSQKRTLGYLSQMI